MQAGTERPRFRQDLFAEAIDEQGAKYIDVMDPDSGRVFRFYEVEFSIACAMDGERDVPGLVKWAQDELGVTPSAHEVQTVIATLGELGYLDMAAATKAAAAEAPARSGLAAAAAPTSDTVVDAPALKVPAARTPTPAERAPARAPAAAAAGSTSDLSLDLSEHLAVGREDVQEAVRQSRVMAAVELPPELAAAASTPKPTTPAERPAARPAPTPAERPVARPAPVPAETKPPVRPTPVPTERPPVRPTPLPVEAKPPERTPIPVETKPPEPPVEVKPPVRPTPIPVETRPPEVQKPPVEVPKLPEKQPVVPPEPPRRMSPVLIVLLILVVFGVGAFLVWKLALDKPSAPAGPVGAAPVEPQPQPEPPPGPPPKPTVTAKLEMSSGRPKTILAYFPGTIEWIETSGKEVKSNDVIMKLRGYKPLEAQVAALKKEAEKVQTEVAAAYKARDAVPPEDEAARQKAQAKVDAAEKLANTKADQLQKKSDQLEKHFVRLIVDGTLTVTRKVGDKIEENTPIATIVPPPAPSATFQIPPDVKVELGTATALALGEKLLTCEVADWEPEKLRIACPEEQGLTEGATVSWQLP